MPEQVPKNSPGRIVFIGILSWLSMLGVDFFLHGGLLAKYHIPSRPFLLPPLDAVRLIPLGCLSFLLLNILLLWLMLGLDISGWQ